MDRTFTVKELIGLLRAVAGTNNAMNAEVLVTVPQGRGSALLVQRISYDPMNNCVYIDTEEQGSR